MNELDEYKKKIKPEVDRQVAEQLASARQALAQQQAETAMEFAFLGIYKMVIGRKRLVENVSNRNMILSWLQPGETLTPALFAEIVKDRKFASQLSWEKVRSPKEREQEARAELEADKQGFSELCRTYRVLECEANFNLWRETRNFSGLAPATAEKIQKWNEEAEEQRREHLLNAPVSELRRLAEQEAASRQSEASKQVARDIEGTKTRDEAVGYPPLPKSVEDYDIKNADASQLRFWIKKYGASQLTARLREKD